jgi:nitrile hydratase beta subunit
MNGVHDMGGMHGLGPVAPDPNEPLFHAEWERRVLALTLAMGAWGRWNIDVSRHARESIRGDRYLAQTYYERWFEGLTKLIERSDLMALKAATPPLAAEAVVPAMRRRNPYTRPETAPAVFAVGDSVRAKIINPTGHTRLPRYARGRVGVIVADHGVHVFPDSNAHGKGEDPHRLYGVRFTAREIWGETASARDTVCLDLWEPYLDPA